MGPPSSMVPLVQRTAWFNGPLNQWTPLVQWSSPGPMDPRPWFNGPPWLNRLPLAELVQWVPPASMNPLVQWTPWFNGILDSMDPLIQLTSLVQWTPLFQWTPVQ